MQPQNQAVDIPITDEELVHKAVTDFYRQVGAIETEVPKGNRVKVDSLTVNVVEVYNMHPSDPRYNGRPPLRKETKVAKVNGTLKIRLQGHADTPL